MRPRTNCGAYTRDHIRLNRPDLVAWRQTRAQIAAELTQLEKLAQTLRQTILNSPDAVGDELVEKLAALESQIARLRKQYF